MILPTAATLNGLPIHGTDAEGLRLEQVTVERQTRAVQSSRPMRHGILDRSRFYGGAQVGLRGWVFDTGNVADAAMQDAWSAFLGASRMVDDPIVFAFQPRGEEPWWRYEVVESDAPTDSAGVAGWAAWEGAWTSSRPWAESTDEVAATYHPTMGGGGTGLVWPITWPIDWSGGSGDDASDLLQAVNEGNTITYPQFTITGPVTNPTVRNETAERTVHIVGVTLAAGDTLTVDTFTRRLTLIDASERPDLIDSAQTRWWGLQPGSNLIRLDGAGMTEDTELRVTYRHARYF